jgi:hypothetical protein
MKRVLKYALIALLAAGSAGILTAGVAYAQGNGPHPPGTLLELLGLSGEDLQEQIQEGKTLAEIAESAGVDLDVFQQEMQEIRQETMQARIQEALKNGELTKEHASWLLEGLKKGFLEKAGFLLGRGSAGDGNWIPRNGFHNPNGLPRGGRQN